MKIINRLLSSAALAFAAFSATAGTTDADGMPVFYLRGSFAESNWGVNESFRFTRNGNTYTLDTKNIVGEFKISDDNWEVNFGGSEKGIEINQSVTVTGVQDGPNFKGDIGGSLKIEFDYTAFESAEIKFTVDGTTPVIPDHTSGTLPVLYINVRHANGSFDNEIIDRNLDHKNYFDGEYWLDIKDCQWLADLGAENIGSADAPLPLQIKARGNYTRKAFAKKPFKLKLAAKQSLLGLSKSKHFAILAHADDNCGYLRNFTGFNLGQRIGLPWTPSQQPVEVVINGDYRGLYFLTESIRIEKGRINIQELDDLVSDPALVSGGYLVELDNYDEENQIQLEEKGAGEGIKDKLRVTFDTPEEYSELQRRFITDQFTTMNDLIGENSDDLWKYMDIDDAARYYIVEEIISHTEAYHGSTYLFRDHGQGQKWHFSPLWDCGNAFNGPTDDYFYRHSPFGATWISSLKLNDKFNDKVRATWQWFMSSKFDGLYADIDAYCSAISEAAKADRKRWAGAKRPDGETTADVADNSDMNARKAHVNDHLRAKINWLKSTFGDYTDATYAEPERDTTPAAPLPDYAVSGVESITSDADAAPAYYNLQGMPVARPTAPGIYIIRRAGTTAKVRL